MAQHFHSLCFHQQVLLKLQTRHGGRHKGVTRRLQQRWNGEQGFGFALSQGLAPLLYMESMERVLLEQQAQTGLSHSGCRIWPFSQQEQSWSSAKLCPCQNSAALDIPWQRQFNSRRNIFLCILAGHYGYSLEQSPLAAAPLRIVSCLI